jgi:hypothetical protein
MWLIALVLLAIAAYFIVRLLLTKNEQSDISGSEASKGGGTSGGATHSGDASLPVAGNIDEATQNANLGGEPLGNPGETPAVEASVAATAEDTSADTATAGIATGAAAAGVAIGAVAAAGVTAADAAAADAAAAGVTSSAAASPATATSTATSSTTTPAVSSGNHILDIQDMLKILNLRDSDASRLAISREQYNSLKTGDAGDLNSEQVQGVVSRLQQMMD